jgi:hypothetical protein
MAQESNLEKIIERLTQLGDDFGGPDDKAKDVKVIFGVDVDHKEFNVHVLEDPYGQIVTKGKGRTLESAGLEALMTSKHPGRRQSRWTVEFLESGLSSKMV